MYDALMPKRRSISAERLHAFPLLDGVSLPARRDLLEVSEQRDVRAGEVLIHQGQPNDTMYLLIEGELAVYLGDPEGEPVAILSAGEIVGEMSLLDGSVASANVVSHTECTLLAVSEQAFWTLINGSHGFAVRLLVSLSERLRANNATVSTSVEKRRMYERAAMFDGLTGIHNRRWLDETLHRLEQRYRKSPDHELSVSLIDIDHFKRFNDTYGHDAGDHVLTVVATTLAQNLRPTDLVARFGGEEFVIIFPDTKLADALVAAERVRLAVAAETLTVPDGRELPSVTISMGVAQLEPGQTVAEFLKTADNAMYRAKRAGRNRAFTGTRADLNAETVSTRAD